MVVSEHQAKFWVIIPAAGIGSRMMSDKPKQYQLLANQRLVIDYSVSPLLNVRNLAAVIVATAQDDHYWHQTELARHTFVERVTGGPERHSSVLNALVAIEDRARSNDWVVVHDAVRPCLHDNDVKNLIQKTTSGYSDGGLLVTAVNDTLKYSTDGYQVSHTVNRDFIWRALTPQIFPYDKLKLALETIKADDTKVTDESQAMENLGYKPLLVKGRQDNIKITYDSDLYIVRYLLSFNALT